MSWKTYFYSKLIPVERTWVISEGIVMIHCSINVLFYPFWCFVTWDVLISCLLWAVLKGKVSHFLYVMSETLWKKKFYLHCKLGDRFYATVWRSSTRETVMCLFMWWEEMTSVCDFSSLYVSEWGQGVFFSPSYTFLALTGTGWRSFHKILWSDPVYCLVTPMHLTLQCISKQKSCVANGKILSNLNDKGRGCQWLWEDSHPPA